MSAVVLVCASSVLLAGCASERVWPAEVSAADLAALASAENDAVWNTLDLPDDQRPVVLPHEPADAFQAAGGFVQCMRAAGYIDRYTSTENSIGMMGPDGLETADERVQWYRCFAQNPRSHVGEVLGSLARRSYLYDYYRSSLVPCLAMLGYPTRESPSREQFLAGTAGVLGNPYFAFNLWSPYDVLTQTVLNAEVDRVEHACPPFPRELLALQVQGTLLPFTPQNG